MKAINTGNQYLVGGPFPLDVKTFVGTGFTFETVEELIAGYAANLLYEGMLVQDSNNSVTWQIYLDGTTWKKRLYDGTFYVDAVEVVNVLDPTSETNLVTVDGVVGADGNVVLLPNCFDPINNGIWIMHSGTNWERHPIFNDNLDDLVGVIIRATGGTLLNNSLWQLSNFGTITIGVTKIYFEEILNYPIISINSLSASKKYSTFAPTSNQVIILGINLVPGMEYLCKKINNLSKSVVLVKPGTLEHVCTLSKKDDWVRIIPMGDYLDYWFIDSSNQKQIEGKVYVNGATSGTTNFKKENTYIYWGLPATTTVLNMPIDCYDDTVYYAFIESPADGNTITLYDYDGVTIGTHTARDGGGTYYTEFAKTKYCTAKNIAASNSTLKIKIPALWKLKDIVLEQVATTTQATGQILVSTTDPVLGETFTIGDETYTLVTARTNKYEVTLSNTQTTMCNNIVTALTADSKYVTAVRSGNNVNLTAKEPYLGTLGNAISLTESVTGFTVSGALLTSGTTSWPGAVTIDVGTSAYTNDIIDDQLVASAEIVTVPINKILSKTSDTTLYISSADWNSATLNVYATRDEGISKSL